MKTLSRSGLLYHLLGVLLALPIIAYADIYLKIEGLYLNEGVTRSVLWYSLIDHYLDSLISFPLRWPALLTYGQMGPSDRTADPSLQHSVSVQLGATESC